MKIVTNDCIAGKVSLTQLVEQIRIRVSCAIKYFRIKFEWLTICVTLQPFSHEFEPLLVLVAWFIELIGLLCVLFGKKKLILLMDKLLLLLL